MRSWNLSWLCLLLVLSLAAASRADTLTFLNGDQVTGTLIRADSHTLVFHSDMAGELTAPWSRIRELRTNEVFVIVRLNRSTLQGQLLAFGPSLQVFSDASIAAQALGASEIRMIVDPKTYAEAVNAHPLPWQAWRGMVSGGFSQVSATQSSTSYTAQVNLQRPVPTLAWLPQRADTIIRFSGTYGRLSQPHEPTVRTSIYSAGLEQDLDLNARLFVFANSTLDHNLAQGLELQQSYGGGVGWKLIQSAATQLDLRADLHFTHQRFLSAAAEQFPASSFTESLHQNYGKIAWTQSLSLTPSYTNGLAYQMAGLSSWAVPLYRSFALNFTVVDSYINNPQPGFLRNSLQYSTGIQFAVR